jgi:hypothetical protein
MSHRYTDIDKHLHGLIHGWVDGWMDGKVGEDVDESRDTRTKRTIHIACMRGRLATRERGRRGRKGL